MSKIFNRTGLLGKVTAEKSLTTQISPSTKQVTKKPIEHKELQQEHHSHSHPHHLHKYSESWLKLILCVGGIYFFFLTWGVLQERIATIAYLQPDGSFIKFSSFPLLNALQSLTAAIIALIFIKFIDPRKQHISHLLKNKPLLVDLGRVALTSCIASPFSYAALKHLSYPTMVLGKSCKLVPVMLMNVLVGGKKFSPIKYITVALITVGVCSFMLLEEKSTNSKNNFTSWHGLLLLLINLALDGATNSWQDTLFIKWHITSQQLMLFMNVFSCLFLTTHLVITQPFNNQLISGLTFLSNNPSAVRDLLAFCVAGALGQVFIFLTIESFGSLFLVTVTVTRKLMTILISLIWFNHKMNGLQWISVGLVFLALALESFFKKTK